MATLFDPVSFGDIHARNRILMAPMTRSRADADGVLNASAVDYYRQRASAGVIISEGVNVAPMSAAFERAPGLWSNAQVAGWRAVADAVHAEGGLLVLQLWHAGRAGARGLIGDPEPLSPSGVNDDLAALQVWGLLANGQYVRVSATPSRALKTHEVEAIVGQYRTSAALAFEAGADGVEIHAANGYLPHQFLSPTTNRRSDRYGGDARDRARFLEEVLDAVAEVVPLSRVGVRVSPFADYNNVRDPDPHETYAAVVEALERRKIAYLHLADTNAWTGAPDRDRIMRIAKPAFSGAIVLNGGISPDAAGALVERGEAEAVAFGRLFLANPDLPERIALSGPYNEPLRTGLYGGTERGYTDYAKIGAVAVGGG